MHVCKGSTICTYIYIYMYTFVPLAANRFLDLPLCTHVYMYVFAPSGLHSQEKVYVCMRACMHVCVCAHTHLYEEQLKDRIRRWLGGGHGIEVTLRGSQGFTGSRRVLGFRSLGLEFKFRGLVEGLRLVCSLSLLVACSCRS